MNIAVTSHQMKIAESYMIDDLGLPSLVLMEKAAEKVAKLCENHPTVCVLCGCGNNGGDGIAVARILHQKGINVSVCIIGDESRATEEFLLQKSIYSRLNGSIISEPDYSASLIVDAMLGIGIKGEVRGRYKDVILALNEQHAINKNTIISIDIPSGLNADDGTVFNTPADANPLCPVAVKADCTVCLGYIKTGLLLNDGPNHTGKLMCEDIGIEPPKDYTAKIATMEDIRNLIPKRSIISNKSSYGKVTIIAGSEGMPGAALLAARAAFSSGAGMVKLLTDKSVIPTIVAAMPEVMVDDYNNQDAVRKSIDWCGSLLIGPGLGRSKATEELFVHVMEYCEKPMVIDADGLNILSSHMDCLKNRTAATVLTPHPGEFQRLFNTSKEDRKHRDIDFLRGLARKYKITILAKDHNSLITDGELVFINTFGTDALATAGTGDVLAGTVLTMLINSDNPTTACVLASAIHGLSGQISAEESNAYAVTASDVARNIPRAVNRFV